MAQLTEKKISSERGTTYYWVSEAKSSIALVFLPGLTADHRLLEQQTSFFKGTYKVIVWDCPCHGKSRPYNDFSYSNIALELDQIVNYSAIKLPEHLMCSHWL